VVNEARAGVQYLNADEAKKAVTEEGYNIIDIRDASQYARSHIPKSVHVPLFIANEGTDPGESTLFSSFLDTTGWENFIMCCEIQGHVTLLRLGQARFGQKLFKERICCCIVIGILALQRVWLCSATLIWSFTFL